MCLDLDGNYCEGQIQGLTSASLLRSESFHTNHLKDINNNHNNNNNNNSINSSMNIHNSSFYQSFLSNQSNSVNNSQKNHDRRLSLNSNTDTPRCLSTSEKFDDFQGRKNSLQNDKINKNERNERSKRSSIDLNSDLKNEQKDLLLSTDILSKCRKLDILVVDDCHQDRNNLCKILIDDGHNCFQAIDGYEAIEKYLIVKSLNDKLKLPYGTILSFDIIILDFIMPNMDGPQCAHKLRSIGFTGFILGLVNLPISQVWLFLLSIFFSFYYFILLIHFINSFL